MLDTAPALLRTSEGDRPVRLLSLGLHMVLTDGGLPIYVTHARGVRGRRTPRPTTRLDRRGGR